MPSPYALEVREDRGTCRLDVLEDTREVVRHLRGLDGANNVAAQAQRLC